MLKITLNDVNDIAFLQSEVEKLNTSLKEPIIDAVKTLENYRETIEFEPAEALRILGILGIGENQTPRQMNEKIHSSEKAFILRKKFFNSTISKTKLETLLFEVVSDLSAFVHGDVLKAITDLVKNMILICLNESIDTEYSEICFRFFTRDENNDIVILVINVNYEETTNQYGFFSRVVDCFFQRAKISFFGAVVKTFRGQLDGK